jgi:hypothetical protein
MTNPLNITAAMSGGKFGMHGDMSAVLNFVPDNHFIATFFAQDANPFTIFSNAGTFRQVDGTTASSLTFQGVNKSVTLMFDAVNHIWEMPVNNLIANGGGGGGGSPGVAATIELGTYQQVPSSEPLEVTMGGTPTARTISFKFPQPAAGGGGGSGTFTPEVLVTQATDGSITLNKAQGSSFRVMMTKAGKMLNPIGYSVGEEITVALRQGPLGPFALEWDLNWAHPDRQIPILALQPGGLNKVKAYLTAAIDVGNPGGWETDVSPKGSTIGYGVPSFIARNVTRNISYYVLRSATMLSAMTSMLPGETLKILRNGLGIEAYGAIDGNNGTGNFLISGAQPNGSRAELRTGPGIRTAFDKGVLAFSGNIVVTVQDLILSGAREQSGTSRIAQGVNLSGNANVILNNVRISDCENGILSGNIGNTNPADDFTGTLTMNNCEIDGCGIGDDGFTHGIYMGHNNADWSANDTTFRGAVLGHNVKSRTAITRLNRCSVFGSVTGREVELPNGGRLYLQDGFVQKLLSAGQNDMIRIGDEGVDTTRPREYILRNMHLQNLKDAANASSFIWNEDPDTDVYVIDCLLEGAKTWPGCDANGMRGRVIVQYTGGPIGPRVAYGVNTIPVTTIAG